MRKFLFLVCLCMTSLNILAHKEYLIVAYSSSGGGMWVLCGYPPGNMKSEYKISSSAYGGSKKTLALILNDLAEFGYEIEFAPDDNNYILSKKASGSSSGVRSVSIENEDVTEVARYNLQGLPVKEHDKGVQIIVYSNYTTKTVIVQ